MSVYWTLDLLLCQIRNHCLHNHHCYYHIIIIVTIVFMYVIVIATIILLSVSVSHYNFVNIITIIVITTS
jgi:hypothetical protein